MNTLRQFIYNNKWFLLIVLLSLLLKVALLLQGKVINPDAVIYIAAAKKHAHGLFNEGLHYYRMPFYPLLLALTHVVIPDWILAGQLLTIIPLVLALWPLYTLTQRLFNRESALWTMLLFAVLPAFNTVSTSIMRDPLFLLFVLSALLFLVVCYQDRRPKAMIGFSLFTVLAVMTRIEGVLLPVIALVVLFVFWRRSLPGAFQVRTVAGLILIPLALAAMLWGLGPLGINASLRLSEVSIWITSLVSLEIFTGYQHLMQALKALQQTLPRSALTGNLLETTRHYAPLIYVVGLTEIITRSIFPTSLLAFWAFRRREKKTVPLDRWLILLPWVAFVLLNLLFLLKMNFVQGRYLWIPIVLSLPWIGYGVSLWWQQRDNRKFVATLVIMLILLAPLSKTVAVAAKPQDTTIVEAGLWLRDYDPLRQLAILYNDRRLPLYADRVFEFRKTRKLKHLRKSAQRKKGVELVVLYLSNKKKENYAIEGFEPVKVIEGENKTVVFLRRT